MYFQQVLLKCGQEFLHLGERGGGADIEGGSDFGPFEVHANLSTTSAVVS